MFVELYQEAFKTYAFLNSYNLRKPLKASKHKGAGAFNICGAAKAFNICGAPTFLIYADFNICEHGGYTRENPEWLGPKFLKQDWGHQACVINTYGGHRRKNIRIKQINVLYTYVFILYISFQGFYSQKKIKTES